MRGRSWRLEPHHGRRRVRCGGGIARRHVLSVQEEVSRAAGLRQERSRQLDQEQGRYRERGPQRLARGAVWRPCGPIRAIRSRPPRRRIPRRRSPRSRQHGKGQGAWESIGPSKATYPAVLNPFLDGGQYRASGRVTAMAIARLHAEKCLHALRRRGRRRSLAYRQSAEPGIRTGSSSPAASGPTRSARC